MVEGESVIETGCGRIGRYGSMGDDGQDGSCEALIMWMDQEGFR